MVGIMRSSCMISSMVGVVVIVVGGSTYMGRAARGGSVSGNTAISKSML